jgi:hypothetical protein
VHAATLVLALAGCADWRAPADFDEAGLRGRAVSATKGEVSVSAAVLGAEDSHRMFGVDLAENDVHAVWVEVRNGTRDPLWLLRPGTDPDYFSPHEVAWVMHMPIAGAANERIDEHFDRRGFKNPIPPGATVAGVHFTHPERRTKLLNIDLFQPGTLIPFTLFLPVVDNVVGPDSAQTFHRYPAGESTDYKDLGALRAALERLPCCATDAAGTAPGDPLNAIFVGEFLDIGPAVVRRGFRRDPQAIDRTQHVFGREPDFVLRKQAQGGAPATWVRGWLTPVLFDGRAIYLVQVGRPVGGRFGPQDSWSVVLHGNVDEARNYLVQDMMYSGGLSKLGFVTGVGPAPPTEPRTTFGGARFHTDGLRAVLFFSTRPLSLSDVEILDWVPFIERPETSAREESGARK